MGRNAAPASKVGFAPQQYGMASSAIVSQSQAPEKLARQQFLAPETMSQNGFGYAPSTATNTGQGGGFGGGPCFTAPVGVKTPEGLTPIGDFPQDAPFTIENETGRHEATLLIHDHKGWMIQLAEGKLVTLDHRMKDGDKWVAASIKYPMLPRLWFEGKVYNMHVITENEADKHYILFNGDVAHNNKEVPENDNPFVGMWRY